MAPTSFRVQGWDPILILCQIFALQSLHYLSLSIIIPPLLTFFAEPSALAYVGGASNVGMLMDWREMAGLPGGSGWDASWVGAWSGGKKLGAGYTSGLGEEAGLDARRAWLIAYAWLIASGIDIYYLYSLIRRPTHILDFAITLLFNHLVLTTYYTASFPTSLFFWLIVGAGTAIMVIFAEHLCVKREMREGLGASEDTGDTVELGALRRD